MSGGSCEEGSLYTLRLLSSPIPESDFSLILLSSIMVERYKAFGFLGIAMLTLLHCCGPNNCVRCIDFKAVDRIVVENSAMNTDCSAPSNIVVVIDATESMKGFILSKDTSKDVYTILTPLNYGFLKIAYPDNIENAIQKAFNTIGKISYYVIKDTLKRDTVIKRKRYAQDTFRFINRRELRDSLLRKEFFNGIANDYSYVFRNILNNIQKDTNQEDTNRLKNNQDFFYIIVTDLFQSDNDITKVMQSIEPLVKGEFSIGIAGFMAPFNGKIYDILGAKKPFLFNGQRRFYFVIVGKYCHIRKFLDALEGDSVRLIFTLNPIDSIRIDSLQLKGIRMFHKGKVSFCGRKTNPRIKGKIYLRVFYDRDVFISNIMGWRIHGYIDNNSEGCRQILKYLKEIKEDKDTLHKEDSLLKFREDKEIAKIDSVKDSMVLLSINFNTPKYAPHCGQRGIILRLEPYGRALEIPKWVNDWSMPLLIRKKDLGRTYNLHRFIIRLYNLYLNRMKAKEEIYGCIQY